jgi:ABC-type multidrug transport system permease subunit
MTILWRNKAYVASRVVMTCFMGLIYGSTFYQTDPTNVQVMLGVIFQAVMFMSLSQGSQIPVLMEAREIFYKQRGANFYQTVSYVVAYSIALMPPSIFEILIFGSLVYWMCGFVATAGAYFIYLGLLVLTNLVLSTWFFALTAMCPNQDIAKPMSSFSIVFIVIFAGFVHKFLSTSRPAQRKQPRIKCCRGVVGNAGVRRPYNSQSLRLSVFFCVPLSFFGRNPYNLRVAV